VSNNPLRQPDLERHSSPWEPRQAHSREEVLAADAFVRSLPDLSIREREDVFRIEALGLEWDIGALVTEPAEPGYAARAPNGRKTGFLLLHGGDGDFKSMSVLARLLAGKYGHRAVAMSFPGRHYFSDPSRDWPGDTINSDGTVRTPIWRIGETVSADQYDIVHDTSQRLRYGTRTLARAKPGSPFWDRMAGWPVAFEEAMIEVCRRHFPDPDWVFFTHGHSTGGAFSAMLTQKVANAAGQAEVETAPIGYINEAKHAWSGGLGKIGDYRPSTQPAPRIDPFNDLSIRTWRDLARYSGPEALGREGPAALMRLPSLMEEVLESWTAAKTRPNFKAEYIVTHNVQASLEAAARASAERLGMTRDATEALVRRYKCYAHYDTRSEARPVPPILYVNAKDSRDNSFEAFTEVVLPMFAALTPAPKVRVVQFGAGTHVYYTPQPDLPLGITPAVVKLWHEAIMGGYFGLEAR
jgi:hypothetical protein